MRGDQPTRHQLAHRLLHEQPHLRINTHEFRQAFVIRAVYVVGRDFGTVADYTGYRKDFVANVARVKGKEMLQAYRGHLHGHDYEKSVVESVKDVGRTIVRAFQKRTFRQRVSDFASKLNFKQRKMSRA